jgi:hypothetical protein
VATLRSQAGRNPFDRDLQDTKRLLASWVAAPA